MAASASLCPAMHWHRCRRSAWAHLSRTWHSLLGAPDTRALPFKHPVISSNALLGTVKKG